MVLWLLRFLFSSAGKLPDVVHWWLDFVVLLVFPGGRLFLLERFVHLSVAWSSPRHFAHCPGIPSYSRVISTSPPTNGMGRIRAEGSFLMSSMSTHMRGVDDLER